MLPAGSFRLPDRNSSDQCVNRAKVFAFVSCLKALPGAELGIIFRYYELGHWLLLPTMTCNAIVETISAVDCQKRSLDKNPSLALSGQYRLYLDGCDMASKVKGERQELTEMQLMSRASWRSPLRPC